MRYYNNFWRATKLKTIPSPPIHPPLSRETLSSEKGLVIYFVSFIFFSPVLFVVCVGVSHLRHILFFFLFLFLQGFLFCGLQGEERILYNLFVRRWFWNGSSGYYYYYYYYYYYWRITFCSSSTIPFSSTAIFQSFFSQQQILHFLVFCHTPKDKSLLKAKQLPTNNSSSSSSSSPSQPPAEAFRNLIRQKQQSSEAVKSKRLENMSSSKTISVVRDSAIFDFFTSYFPPVSAGNLDDSKKKKKSSFLLGVKGKGFG